MITIGTFDGLHTAHHSIIDKIAEMAVERNCESVLVTFDPHPRSIVYPKDKSLQLLTTLEEKIKLLEQTQLDHLVIYPFSIEFSQETAEEYIEDFIINKFQPKCVVIGFDHRYGINRTGDFELLNQYAQSYKFDLIEISKKESNQVKISSTAIRDALHHGDINQANQLLGYRFFLTGKVVKGNNIGTSLGYPTANIKLNSTTKLVPKSGIYAAFVYIEDERYDGLLYIGSKPSVEEGTTVFIEVNLRDFKGYLYGEELKVEFVSFIRGDEKFDSLEELKKQISLDEKQILAVLAAEKLENI